MAEREAQDRDLPRQRVLRDEAMMEIAAQAPMTAEELGRDPWSVEGSADGRQGAAMLEAVGRALGTPEVGLADTGRTS